VLELLVIGTSIAVSAFALVWVLSVRCLNYGFLDVTWSLSIAVLASVYAVLGNGEPLRRLVFTLIAAAWSLRLGLYILVRVWRDHPREDKRYRTLRERWPGPARFLLFFELQALIAVVFSLPFMFAALNPRPGLGKFELCGLTLALCATAGEGLADWQAQRFKRNPANHSAVVFFIAALDSAYGWVSVICPLLMLYLLLNVTGIPLTEKHSLESRGDAYRQYQRTTSRFIPWFRSAAG